jgi:hypothetical protein
MLQLICHNKVATGSERALIATGRVRAQNLGLGPLANLTHNLPLRVTTYTHSETAPLSSRVCARNTLQSADTFSRREPCRWIAEQCAPLSVRQVVAAE